MNNKRNKNLKEAAGLLWEEWKAEIDAAEPTTPSEAFDTQMKRMAQKKLREDTEAEKAYKAEKRRRVIRRLAYAAIILLVLLAGWLILDKTALTKIERVFRWMTGNAVHYEFSDDLEENDRILPVIRPGWLPEGADVLKDETDTTVNTYELLLLYDEEKMFYFHYGFVQDGTDIMFVGDMNEEREYIKLDMADHDLECYVSSTGNSNDYFWVIEEENLYLSITSYLPHEVNLRIIENLRQEDPS